MTDIDKIKAGKYELVAELWDEPKSKPGEPFDFVRHRRGDVVQLDAENARRLVAAGAVVEPGALEKARAEQARLQAEQAEAAAALAAASRAAAAGSATAGADDDGPAGGDELPNKSAPKGAWVAYATHPARGDQVMTASEASSANKADLVKRFAGDGDDAGDDGEGDDKQ